MARNIQDIAPLLADHFIDVEIDAAILKENNRLIADNEKRLGLFHKYLGQLHDSWIIKTEVTAHLFSIVLNDFSTHVFSDVIVEKKKLNIDHDKLVFPICLDFEIISLTFNTVDESGNIQAIEPITINEYLYEQVISVDNNKIEIGLIVWKDGKAPQQGEHILILMSVKNITLTELQANAWSEIFENAYEDYYNYFRQQRNKGRYVSDQSNSRELYEEFEKQRQG